MKPLRKIKDKKRKLKKKTIIKPKKEQVLVVAQEIKFARLLSGNEKKTRDKVLKALKKWLTNCFEKSHVFKEDDFIRVWKGLFYAVWMSDKPLIQEELCESIAGILDLFPAEQIKYALLMMKAGLRVLATEWYGIDHHRMDKFLMLVRRYLRGGLRCLHRCSWSSKSCEMFSKMLTESDGILAVKTPHYARNATSMLMHIADCFLEECSKVSGGEIPEASVVTLVRPFAEYMGFGETPVLVGSCRRVLNSLLRQSELGLKYHHATRAWKQMGCPQGGPEALELVSDDDDDDETLSGDEEAVSDDGSSAEKPLDPRAGRVDVELSSLPVPAAMIAAMLKGMLAKASSKSHKRIKICMQRFEKLSREEYPLPAEVPPTEEERAPKQRVSAKDLLRHERRMVEEADELALRGLSRKQRRRLLAKSRAGLSIVEDVQLATMGGWKVESTNKQSDNHDKDSASKDKKNKRKLSNDDIKMNVKKLKTNHSEQTDTEKVIKDKAKDKKRKDKHTQSTEKVKQNNVPKDKLIIDKKRVEKDTNKKHRTKLNSTNTNASTNTTKTNTNTLKNVIKSDSNIKNKIVDNNSKIVHKQTETKKPSLVVNKVRNFQKQTSPNEKRTECPLKKVSYHTPKKVKFVLKNNSMQGTMDYYKSVRQSPSIPFDGSKQPSKTNLKPSTPSPINPFFKKKLKLRKSM
ncbi:ribosomal RNA processing protein 1 homolog Nnp-1 [Aphomia sociella]